MKRIIWSSAGIALGVLFVVAAISALLDGKVECGGTTMSEGQTCVRENRSGTVVSQDSVEETQTSETVGTIIGMGFGLLIIVVGVQNLRIGLRNRKTSLAHAEPDQPSTWPQPSAPQTMQGPQGWPQPHMQQPYYPQPPHQGGHQQPPRQR